SFGESHCMVEVVTAARGRLALVARGARAPKRRFPGALDLFVDLKMQVEKSRYGLAFISADVTAARLGIRGAYERIERGGRLCEVARYLVQEEQAAHGSYGALTTALDALDAGKMCSAAAAYPILLREAGI